MYAMTFRYFFVGIALLFSIAGVAQAERSGEAIYNGPCKTCHEGGVAGAPRFGDKAAWAPRIAAGTGAMMHTVHNGKGAMPPKGTCMDCSAAELQAAVDYMTASAR